MIKNTVKSQTNRKGTFDSFYCDQKYEKRYFADSIIELQDGKLTFERQICSCLVRKE